VGCFVPLEAWFVIKYASCVSKCVVLSFSYAGFIPSVLFLRVACAQVGRSCTGCVYLGIPQTSMNAPQILLVTANHRSSRQSIRTTSLYSKRSDECITLDVPELAQLLKKFKACANGTAEPYHFVYLHNVPLVNPRQSTTCPSISASSLLWLAVPENLLPKESHFGSGRYRGEARAENSSQPTSRDMAPRPFLDDIDIFGVLQRADAG
jgi:hypothetical protein